MKIRGDFVSNSSSSSFVLWGVSLDIDELTRNLIDSGAIGPDGFTDWVDRQSYDECIIGDCDAVLGLPPDKMRDDETLLQFKTCVLDKLKTMKIPVRSVADIKLIKDVNADGYISID